MRIDYYLSLVSPWTYLGHAKLLELSALHQVPIRIVPVKLSQVFPATGGLPLAKRAPARKNYRLTELRRWREQRGIELNLEPRFFPADDVLACRLVTAAYTIDPQYALRLAGAILKATWAQERNIADERTLLDLITETGSDQNKLIELAKQPEMEDKLNQNTLDAIDRGVFGAPSYIYENELFWGQDRLFFLAQRLEGKKIPESAT